MFVVSQIKAEVISAKTMKASPITRATLVNKSTYKVGLCFYPSGRVTLLGG